MKKLLNNKILLVLLLLFFSYSIKAENNIIKDTTIIKNDTSKYLFPKNYIFFEIAGLGVVYSINYERSILSKNNNNISLRAGGGYIQLAMSSYRDVFLGINYNKFLYNKLILNTGINITYSRFTDYTFSNTTDTSGIYYATNLGINYIPKNHFFVKPNAIFFFSEKGVQFWFGISLGFKFGKQ